MSYFWIHFFLKKHIMKKFNFKLLIVLLVMPALFVMTGCRKDAGMNCNTQSTDLATDFDKLQLPNLPLIQNPDLQESTMDLELSVKADGIPSEEELQISMDEKTKEFKSDFKVNFEWLKFLKGLNLTLEQKIKIKLAMMTYVNCRKDLLVQLQRLTHEIIANGNRERDELMKKYKMKLITAEQLKRELQALNMRIKKAITENPGRIRIIAALEKCHQEFLSSIKEILTRDQMALWIKWYKTGTGKTGTGGK